jgi:putative SOS response-associated peptidase YedK
MCGRYTLYQKATSLKDYYHLRSVPDGLKQNYNVAPGQFMPVVLNEEGKTKLELMKWGLVPFWAKDISIGLKLINARDDTIFEKPTWRNVILKKRCLIPADGFYEWKSSSNLKSKTPFYIKPKHSDLFSFAGVWESRKDAEGTELKTYSIITTSPNKEMQSVHNRMPVILRKQDEPKWLKSSLRTKDEIELMLKPHKDNGLEIYKVSSDVNATINNSSKLIYPISTQ